MESYNGKNVVAIDIEFAQTYKKKLKKAAIMELGMVLVKNFNEEEEVITYDKLINPGVPVNYYVTRVTGITTCMLENEPTIMEEYDKIQEMLDSADLIVLHGGKGDTQALSYSGLDIYKKKVIDTETLAKLSNVDFDNYKLTTLAEHFNVLKEDAHRALDDAQMTLDVFRNLIAINDVDLSAVYTYEGKPINHE